MGNNMNNQNQSETNSNKKSKFNIYIIILLVAIILLLGFWGGLYVSRLMKQNKDDVGEERTEEYEDNEKMKKPEKKGSRKNIYIG